MCYINELNPLSFLRCLIELNSNRSARPRLFSVYRKFSGDDNSVLFMVEDLFFLRYEAALLGNWYLMLQRTTVPLQGSSSHFVSLDP